MSAQNIFKDYIPKEITQQSEFLKKYPNFDGRDVVIAIIDCGLDVSLDGMQKTTTGRPKVIDCFDFTGAGNVDTSVIKEFNNNGFNKSITGLSGRLLNIPSTWRNPSGQWHLGIKSLYELCSEEALQNLIEIRKNFIEKESQKLKYCSKIKNFNNENYKAIIKYLNSTKDLSIDSLVADCIVWFNGEKWQACIDTSFNGNFTRAKVLTDFCVQQDYGIIFDLITYSVKIHNNGNLMEIFTSYTNHGTTVSHIAAGNFPGEQPERNGMAPGAQIILMNVLDPRNGRFCNFKAIKNALHKCIEMKVDIVNISVYLNSEHEEVINEMTEKHGIIITKAAGNCGPVYSSLQSMDVKTKNMFIIGSVFTEKNGDKNDAIIPVYSSRGPGFNGSRGISFVAPGNATTAVPRFCSKKFEDLLGTSFSAPNAAGAIACLLSALKSTGVKYSVFSIKTALEKTAFLPKNSEILGFGHGIIQIFDAFEFLQTYNLSILKNYANRKRKFKIIDENCGKNGILINLKENDVIKDGFEIELSNGAIDFSPIKKKIKLQSTTKTDAETFVAYSNFSENNSFKITIEKEKLKSGTLNYMEIYGIDSTKMPPFNQLFYLPITVILPRIMTNEDGYCIKEENVELKPNFPHRFFILPPKECFQCVVKVFVKTLASLYLQYSTENCTVESGTGKWLEFNEEINFQTFDIQINGNKIHEIAFFPDCYEPVKCNVEIQFYGIEVVCKKLSHHEKNDENFEKSHDEKDDDQSFKKSHREKDDANLKKSQDEKNDDQNVLTFKNNLKNLHASLEMEYENVSCKLSPCRFACETIKDQYDACKNECLKIIYNFTILKESKCLFKLNLENKFEICRVQIFTESKKYVYGFVSYLKEPVTLLPGTYTIIAHMLHSFSAEESLLLSIESLPYITVTFCFDDPLKPGIYNSMSKTKEYKYSEKEIYNFEKNEHKIYFNQIFVELPLSSLPSDTVTLHGSLNFYLNENENIQLKIPFFHEYFCNLLKNVAENVAEKAEDILRWKFDEKTIFDPCTLTKNVAPNGHQEILEQLNSFLNENNFEAVLEKCETLQQKLVKNLHKSNPKFDDSMEKEEENDSNESMIFKGNDLFEFFKDTSKPTYANILPSKKFTKNLTKFEPKILKQISIICQIFHDHVNTDIQKAFNQLKQSFVEGYFGVALLNLNELSTKNRTNPEFKIIDFLIIQVLKHLEWNYLVAEHQNSMLDRHRSSYRLL